MADVTLEVLLDPPQLLELDVEDAPIPTRPNEQTQWAASIYDMDGTYYSHLTTMRFKSFTWTRQPPYSADIEVSIDDPALADLGRNASPPREIRLTRNGHVLLVGPVVTKRANAQARTYTLTIQDPMWYLQHRYIGNPNRTNQLSNPSFQSGTSDWQTNGSLTFTASGTRKYLGTQSAKLVNAAVGDDFIYQNQTLTAGQYAMTVYLTAWFYIESWELAAPFAGGLILHRAGATDQFATGGFQINSTSPRHVWARASCSVRIPPNTTEVVQSRLYAPKGTIYWDAVTLVTDEALHFLNDMDQATILRYLVGYFQGTGPLAARAPEKSDLRLFTNFEETGIVRYLTYHFADHHKAYNGGQGYAVIDGFLNRANSLDLRVTYSGKRRTLKSFYPTSQVTFFDTTFYWRNYPDEPERSSSWGITGWDWGDTIEGSANQICLLGGWGGLADSATREEGGYANSTLGGLSLELVETAEDGTTVNELHARATQRGQRLENAIQTLTLTLVEPRDPVTDVVTYPLIGVLHAGDRMIVDLVDGDVTVQGYCVVVQLTLNEDDSLSAVVNPL